MRNCDKLLSNIATTTAVVVDKIDHGVTVIYIDSLPSFNYWVVEQK